MSHEPLSLKDMIMSLIHRHSFDHQLLKYIDSNEQESTPAKDPPPFSAKYFQPIQWFI